MTPVALAALGLWFFVEPSLDNITLASKFTLSRFVNEGGPERSGGSPAGFKHIDVREFDVDAELFRRCGFLNPRSVPEHCRKKVQIGQPKVSPIPQTGAQVRHPDNMGFAVFGLLIDAGGYLGLDAARRSLSRVSEHHNDDVFVAVFNRVRGNVRYSDVRPQLAASGVLKAGVGVPRCLYGGIGNGGGFTGFFDRIARRAQSAPQQVDSDTAQNELPERYDRHPLLRVEVWASIGINLVMTYFGGTALYRAEIAKGRAAFREWSIVVGTFVIFVLSAWWAVFG